MPSAVLDGVRITYEEAGSGFPLVFCHEFAGSRESWRPQVHYFSRRYRTVTYNARGYPPSGVPRGGGRVHAGAAGSRPYMRCFAILASARRFSVACPWERTPC